VTALTTFFPVYEHTRNIAGDRITVTLLVPMTLDVHSFDPTPSSIQAVATANLLIYGGAGLEPWIPAIVTAAGNAHLTLVDSSKNLSLLDVPPQFQKGGRTIDPHIWLDPIRAKQQVANILEGLIKVDPADATYFTRNAQNYNAKLDLLNSQAINLTANPKTRHFVTFHEAFAYFSMRYNLDQIPIAGPFEEDPTPSEIQGVINATKRYHLCYVGYESLSNPAIAQSIASQTNATLIRLDPIEGLSLEDQTLGKTYLIKMDELLTQLDLMLNHVGCN
jgi:zinc transport system substrate-binding protein